MTRRQVCILTGTRAEYGLLRPVIQACQTHTDLDVTILATGTHLLPPANTLEEVVAEHPDAVQLAMQRPGQTGRAADAAAIGRGISVIAEWIETRPDVAVLMVLGDRIEALAGAVAASVSGLRVAHIHGGDRAEGIADDSIRHAITKLAHIHLAASDDSAARLVRLGEHPHTVHVVGSPAMDGLAAVKPIDDATFETLGAPDIVVLLHPEGRPDDVEHAAASVVIDVCRAHGRTLVMHPNHDPGRDGIMAAIADATVPDRAHLQRDVFLSLLRRVPVLVGNSSAGLIEASGLGVHVINVGRRQQGRQRPGHVIDVEAADRGMLREALDRVHGRPAPGNDGVYGDGDTGRRIAEILASFEAASYPITKCCAH